MKKTIIYTLISAIIFSLNITDIQAQDGNFSQFFNNPLYYNPAFVGLNKGLKARLHYRNQWYDLPGDFSNYNFSLDIADRDIPGAGGLGFMVNSTSEGVGYFQNTTVGFMPSVRIPLAENFIMQVGAMASFVQRQINWGNLVFSDELNGMHGNIGQSTFIPPNDDKMIYPDFSFGGLFQVSGEGVTGVFGGAAHHLTRPSQSFFDWGSPLERRYVVHGDIIFDIGQKTGYFVRKKGFKLNPGIIWQYQAKMNLYSVGMNFYFTSMYFGLWYRNESLEYDTHSDFVLLAGVYIPFGDIARLKLMYSYDMAVTAGQTYTGPSNEISLIFEFDDIKLTSSKKKYRSIRGRKIIEETLECTPF